MDPGAIVRHFSPAWFAAVMGNAFVPLALSFTFPTGALAVASGATWTATGYRFIGSFYELVAFLLLIIWLLVFIRTLREVFSREIFVPST